MPLILGEKDPTVQAFHKLGNKTVDFRISKTGLRSWFTLGELLKDG